MKRQKVSNAVIRRLPRYYRHLTDLSQTGVQRISSSALGMAMNLTASQIRQDLSCFGDVNPALIGTQVSGVPIYPVEELEVYLKENPTSVGVLTVPQSAANDMAQRLVQSGVKGIWNFTNLELHVEDSNTVVEDVHFADSLLTLSYLISEAP